MFDASIQLPKGTGGSLVGWKIHSPRLVHTDCKDGAKMGALRVDM